MGRILWESSPWSGVSARGASRPASDHVLGAGGMSLPGTEKGSPFRRPARKHLPWKLLDFVPSGKEVLTEPSPSIPAPGKEERSGS